MRPSIYRSRVRSFTVGLIYVVGATLASLAFVFAFLSRGEAISPVVGLALLLLPPSWVVVEYYFLFDNWEDQGAVKELKYRHALTGVVWFVYSLFYLMAYDLWWF